MLPTGHVEFTWATLNLLQRKLGAFESADYRWIAAAAIAPDLLDKPLALTIYAGSDAALFWGHNLWFHALTWAGVCAGSRYRRGRQSFALALPYLLAFSGHLLADRMWGFHETLFYPLGAGYWHPWVHVGTPSAMLQAYVDIIRETPLLLVFEIVGFVALAWFIIDRQLWRRLRFVRFLLTGRPPQDDPVDVEAMPSTRRPTIRSEESHRCA